MRPKLHVRRGDMVEIMTGNAKGTRGRVLRTIPRKGRVVVEGVKMVWKHRKRSRQYPRGARAEMEAPIHASNVLLICVNRQCKRYDHGVRARYVKPEGKPKMRVCAKCGAEILKPE